MAPPAKRRPDAGNSTPETTSNQGENTGSTVENERQPEGLTVLGKIGIFLAFPLLVGLTGMYFAYLEQRKNPEREMNMDQDFVMPFLLALAMVIVIGFQTSGYRSREVQPLIHWPKVKRVKRVVHRKNGKIISPNEVADSKKDK